MIYPIGEQDFAGIRRRGLVYVDKTTLVYKLTHESKYYFLSRPRRFGKTLLLSTLENYFLGNREAFQGLAIERMETEWQPYPVLSLSLGKGEYKTPEDLNDRLQNIFSEFEQKYGRNEVLKSYGERFDYIIRQAYEQTGREVVILIDEYDAPFQAALDKPELMAQYQSKLRDIYLCLKANDKHIRFAFLTGITAWGKVGVFSALNNLKDITFSEDYATLCGITEEELHDVFHEEVVKLADKNGLTVEEAYRRLKEQYDGYRFSKAAPGVYNPFSLLCALDSKAFDNYWIDTGRTLSITTLVQHRQIDINELMGEVEADPGSLRSLEDVNENAVPFIYQAGYLTIKGFNPITEKYILQVPNNEVRVSLAKHLAAFAFSFTNREADRFVDAVKTAVYYVRIEELVELLNDHVFRKGNYMTMGAKELYFQQALTTVFLCMGYEVQSEVLGYKGRADLVVKTKTLIYVIETKLNGSAADALAQINEKGYAEAYQGDHRPVVRLGLNFSEQERIIDDFAVETM